MERVKDFMDTFISTIIAIIRLCFLGVCFLTSGLQVILFTRTEICNLEMKGQPLRCDMNKMDEKLSYVDKLMLENPDLLDLPTAPLTPEELKLLEELDNEDDENDQGI